MFLAQANQKSYIKQYCGSTPQYKIRDIIRLDTKNLFIKKSSRKLKNRHTRKYSVKKLINFYAIKSNLSSNLYIYFVFHINFIKSVTINLSHLGYMQPFKLLTKVNKKSKYKISAIINFHIFRRAKKL